MRWYHAVLVPVALAVCVTAVSAGPIFKHPPKPNPNERVPELLNQVKTDKDEHKRSLAAQELRQYDPVAFPEITGVLTDVLFNDAKPNVRGEAAQSLGKLRPVAQSVGWALEQAEKKDTSMWVRLQARTALLQYHWAGYHASAPKKEEGPSLQSGEPPIAGPASNTPVPVATSKVPAPVPTPRPVAVPSNPVPLVPPSASDSSTRLRPDSTPVLVPTEAPKLQIPPSVRNQGPDLAPPPS